MPSNEVQPRPGAPGPAAASGGRTRRSAWGRSRAGRLAIALLAGALTAGLGAGPAQADPREPTPSAQDVSRAQEAARAAAGDVAQMQSQLARARARLQALVDEAERAVEAYNGARYQLQQARLATAAAVARAQAAQEDLQAAELDFGRFAAASYRMGGGLGSFASMLDADGPQDLMDQASDLANLASSHDAALDRVTAARIVADVLQQQATAAQEAQAAATERVRTAKLEAQAKVRTQQAQIGGLQRLADQLSAKLAKTRARAGQLADDRRAGLARERAARAAAAAAAAAAQNPPPAGSDDGGSSGWSPPLTGGTSHGTVKGAARAIAYARDQLGKPYVYAAAGPDSFDCSGLTMMAWRAGGVDLPHWSVAQFAQARKIPASKARPGDLVFYAYDVTDPGTIHHVGLYIGGGMMIHAPHTGDVVREAAVYSDGLIGFARP